jgi:hypothetical protein
MRPTAMLVRENMSRTARQIWISFGVLICFGIVTSRVQDNPYTLGTIAIISLLIVFLAIIYADKNRKFIAYSLSAGAIMAGTYIVKSIFGQSSTVFLAMVCLTMVGLLLTLIGSFFHGTDSNDRIGLR